MIHIPKPEGLWIPCPYCYDGYLKLDKYSKKLYCVNCKKEIEVEKL